jgi:hypothetical protein
MSLGSCLVLESGITWMRTSGKQSKNATSVTKSRPAP